MSPSCILFLVILSVDLMFPCVHIDLTFSCVIQSYEVNSRGLEIFSKSWLPGNSSIKALVCFCHGYGDTCTFFFEGSQFLMLVNDLEIEIFL